MEPLTRRLLYEIDMAITALRQQAFAAMSQGAGESPEVMRLTSRYHNLMRVWADA